MDKEEFKAQQVLSEIQRQQKLVEEFEKLRPTWKSDISVSLSYMVGLIIVCLMFPEVLESPVLYVIFLLLFAKSGEIYHANKKVHKRIDLLHRMYQGDV